jgi:hypothetical protein
MRTTIFGKTAAAFGLLVSMMAIPALAEVNINVNIGPPPPVVVATRPAMVFLPEPAVYVAVGVPYDIYFVSGRYYYMHGDHWFWGSGYDGPWVVVEQRHLPPGLAKYKVVKLREYRDREYKVYKVQGPGYKGKHFDADPGPGSKARSVSQNSQGDNHQGNQGNSSKSSGNGRGKGKK